eukprot:TRINITY_DN1046_c0_g1_i4.p1 TRINITY_DN1046_c0_g1~~TRINITY_DN1046_c0_g1_i4.p1  ORF type:complete len:125 (+),score=7.22 TRINITY_DN1046_c0_g1_i4:105-479(+)
MEEYDYMVDRSAFYIHLKLVCHGRAIAFRVRFLGNTLRLLLYCNVSGSLACEPFLGTTDFSDLERRLDKHCVFAGESVNCDGRRLFARFEFVQIDGWKKRAIAVKISHLVRKGWLCKIVEKDEF